MIVGLCERKASETGDARSLDFSSLDLGKRRLMEPERWRRRSLSSFPFFSPSLKSQDSGDYNIVYNVVLSRMEEVKKKRKILFQIYCRRILVSAPKITVVKP